MMLAGEALSPCVMRVHPIKPPIRGDVRRSNVQIFDFIVGG
jgi:hypothetical protein